MNDIQEKLNQSLELLLALDKKSSLLFSEDLKAIAEKIHSAYGVIKKQLEEKEKEVGEHKEHVEKLCRNIRILEERVKDGDKELSEQIEATNRNAEKGLLAVMELSELKAKHKDYVETFIQFYEQSMKLQEHTADQHFIDWEDESIEGVLDFENARKKAFLIIKYYTQTHGQ